MLQQLKDLFEGKRVRITHTNKRVEDDIGVCRTIHATPEAKNLFQVELENGVRLTFAPEICGEDYVDGPLETIAGGRRKIKIMPFPKDRQVVRDTIKQLTATTGLGGVVTVVNSTLVGMLSRLETAYEDKITINGFCAVLLNLARDAEQMRRQLSKKN